MGATILAMQLSSCQTMLEDPSMCNASCSSQ